MKALNILMLGAAKRVSVARFLISEGEKLGRKVNLFSYELAKDVAISSVAKIIVGKRWSDPDIMTDLLEICSKKRIHIILPFVDQAIEICANLKNANPKIFYPGSEAVVSQALFNKATANNIFAAHLLPIPQFFNITATATPESLAALPYPLILKPKFGSASKGIKIANSAADLNGIENFDDYLIQEYIADREEITVDCYITQNLDLLTLSPRLRLEVAGGEVVRTITIRDNHINRICDKLIRLMSLTGAVTIQLIRDRSDKRLMIMEINPRLGGGVVCSIHAGANITSLIIREALGMPLCAMPAKPGIEIARYPQEVVVKP